MIIRSSLKEQAYNHLKDAVIEDKLKMGTLYSEQWCAEYLKISRTPIREALLQMQEENIIKILPNRGIEINPISEQELRNIFQMRTAMESYCVASLASQVDTPAGKQAISRLKLNIENEKSGKFDAENMKKYIDSHMEFHREIINFLDNPYFTKIFNSMQFRIAQLARDLYSKTGRAASSLSDHGTILMAIKSGDEKEAVKATNKHLEAAKNDLKNNLLTVTAANNSLG